MDRVITLIDMDAFYVQVEQRAAPELIGKPCAVVQYKGGGIIALNSEAKALGVKRYTTGQDARQMCPSLHLFKVQENRGKADLTKYREAGAEVIRILVDSHAGCVERASVDEAFVDLTDEVNRRLHSFSASDQWPNTVVVGYDATETKSSASIWLSHITDDSNGECDGDRALAVGAAIVEELRAAIFEKAGFRCSAGVAHNKVLAKLACGINKPNKQTVLPKSAIHHVFTKTPLSDVRGFGGKFGEFVVEKLHVEFMADLCQFTEIELQAQFGERASWIYNICRGIDNEPVIPRQIVQSIACSKNFPGRDKLTTIEKVRYWLSEFSREACERLVKDKEKNNRIAKTMSVSVTYESFPVHHSATRSYAISRYDADKFAADAWALIHQFNTAPAAQQSWSPAILHLGLSAGKFINLGNTKEGSIHKFFSSSNLQVSGASKSNSSAVSSACLDSSGPEEEFEISKYFCRTGEDSETDKTFEKTYNSAPNDVISTPLAAFSQTKPLQPVVNGVVLYRSVQNLDPLSEKSVKKKSAMVRSFDKLFAAAKPKIDEAGSVTNDNRFDTCVTQVLETSEYLCQAKSSKTESMEVLDLLLKRSSTRKKLIDEGRFGVAGTKTALFSEQECSPNESSNVSLSARALDCGTGESSSVDDTVQCEHCGVDVSPWELPEHLDWHVAVDLQKSERAMSISRPDNESSLVKDCYTTVSKKRKTFDAKSMSGEKKIKSSLEGLTKISTFFTPGALN